MRRVEGVIDRSRLADADSIKKYALFFDKLHLIKVYGLQSLYDMMHTSGLRDPSRAEAEFDYLQEQGFIAEINDIAYLDFMRMMKSSNELDSWVEFVQSSNIVANAISEEFGPKAFVKRPEDRVKKAQISDNMSDCYVRITSLGLAKKTSDVDIVPICCRAPQNGMLKKVDQKQIVLEVALDQFPTPGPTSAWEDVLDFREEMHEKQWHFRRFLHSLATKKQTEAEIRDDIEWTLNEYFKAMKIHHLKTANGFVEVYVIPVIELVEDVAKFNWSKVAKGLLSVKKRQVELMEAEMKVPGRECAYVFEAQRRFGSRS